MITNNIMYRKLEHTQKKVIKSNGVKYNKNKERPIFISKIKSLVKSTLFDL